MHHYRNGRRDAEVNRDEEGERDGDAINEVMDRIAEEHEVDVGMDTAFLIVAMVPKQQPLEGKEEEDAPDHGKERRLHTRALNRMREELTKMR